MSNFNDIDDTIEQARAYYAARLEITELRRQLRKQSLYIAELEKQLEYISPGVVKEVQEFLEVKEGR